MGRQIILGILILTVSATQLAAQSTWTSLPTIGSAMTGYEANLYSVPEFGVSIAAMGLRYNIFTYSVKDKRWVEATGIDTALYTRRVPPNVMTSHPKLGIYLAYHTVSGIDAQVYRARWFRSIDSGKTFKELFLGHQIFKSGYDFSITNSGVIVGIQRDAKGGDPMDTLQDSVFTSFDGGLTFIPSACPDTLHTNFRVDLDGDMEVFTSSGWYASHVDSTTWWRIDSVSIPIQIKQAERGRWVGQISESQFTDSNSYLVSTVDTGRSWQPMEPNYVIPYLKSLNSWYLVLVHRSTVILSGQTNNGEPSYWRISTDSGHSWKTWDTLTIPQQVFVVSDSILLVRTSNWGAARPYDALLRISENGKVWHEATRFPRYYLKEMTCPDNRTILMSTHSGRMISSYSGGVTWNDATENLSQVTLLDMHHYVDKGDLRLFGLTEYGVAVESSDDGDTWTVERDFTSTLNVSGDTVLVAIRGEQPMLVSYGNQVDTIEKRYGYVQYFDKLDSEFISGQRIWQGGEFPLNGNVTLFSNVDDSAMVALKDTAERTISFENIVDVIKTTDDTRFVFGQLMSTRDDYGELVSRPGSIVRYKPGEPAIKPVVPPFDTQRWIYDVISLGNDSVLIAVASKVNIVGHGDPTPSSGTLWKGSLKTLEFRLVNEGRTDDGSSLSRNWCFTLASNGTIYASAVSGGIIRSRDNGETWSSFERDFTSRFSIRGIHAAGNYLFMYTTNGLYRMDWTTTDVTENNQNSIALSLDIRPLPASDHVTIDVSNWASNQCSTLGIYDLAGELQLSTLMCSSTTTVDVSALCPGVYVAVLSDSNDMKFARLQVIR